MPFGGFARQIQICVVSFLPTKVFYSLSSKQPRCIPCGTYSPIPFNNLKYSQNHMTHVTSDYPVQPRVGANLNLTSHQQRPTPPTYLPGTTRPCSQSWTWLHYLILLAYSYKSCFVFIFSISFCGGDGFVQFSPALRIPHRSYTLVRIYRV